MDLIAEQADHSKAWEAAITRNTVVPSGTASVWVRLVIAFGAKQLGTSLVEPLFYRVFFVHSFPIREMERLEGFEPSTFALATRCYWPLSYSRSNSSWVPPYRGAEPEGARGVPLVA